MYQTKEDLDRLYKEVYAKETYPMAEVKEYLEMMVNLDVIDKLIAKGRKARYGLRLKESLPAVDLFRMIFITIEMTHDKGLWRNEQKCLKMIAWLEKEYNLV